MDGVLKEIKTYNLFNYLFTGIFFGGYLAGFFLFFCDQSSLSRITQVIPSQIMSGIISSVFCFMAFYFYGMFLSRLGSNLLTWIYDRGKAGIGGAGSYKQFYQSLFYELKNGCDPLAVRLEMLAEARDVYRTVAMGSLVSSIVTLSSAITFSLLGNVSKQDWLIVIGLCLFWMLFGANFIYATIKQNKFVLAHLRVSLAQNNPNKQTTEAIT